MHIDARERLLDPPPDERRDSRAETAGGTGAGQIGEGAKLVHPGEPRLELLDLLRRSALLRREGAGRSPLAEQGIPHVAEPPQHPALETVADDLPEPGPAVDRRRVAEADEERAA